MNIIWKYKINIKNEDIFNEIENERGIVFPKELKDFILKRNASTPSKYHFMLGVVEKVLGAVLSFNRDETDTDTVFSAFTAIEDTNLIPFAIDPFGNYICYTLNDSKIVFWDHETDAVTSTHKGLHEFLESLY